MLILGSRDVRGVGCVQCVRYHLDFPMCLARWDRGMVRAYAEHLAIPSTYTV